MEKSSGGSEEFICLCATNYRCLPEWYVFPVELKSSNVTVTGTGKRDGSGRLWGSGYQYHKHDMEDTGRGKLTPCFFSVSYMTLDSGCIMLGSTLYHLGICDLQDEAPFGPQNKDWEDFYSRHQSSHYDLFNDPLCGHPNPQRCFFGGSGIFYRDLDSPGDGCWKVGPSMKVPRYNPQPIVLDGKIYVFGGGDRYPDMDMKKKLWAEVFDPSLQQWELLPPPPFDDVFILDAGTELITAALVDDGPKRIVVGFRDTFYTYYVTDRCWVDILECPGHCLDEAPCRCRAAVAGRTLYWFSYDYTMVALDLDQKTWLQGRVESCDFGFVGNGSFRPRLIHLHGDCFCLLWISWISPDVEQRDPRTDPSRIHCARVRVLKEFDSQGKGVLRVSFESCQSYVVDQFIGFVDGWLIDEGL